MEVLEGDLGSILAMVPGNSGAEQTPIAAARLDSDSAEWLRVLADTGQRREAALARLHEMLLRIARGEVRRRGPRLQLNGRHFIRHMDRVRTPPRSPPTTCD
ncbi:MAG TPA: hypothetical protein VFJ07_13810 [Streptosporangiaceae bacterium]|nr:hypothetical protein [Streptosporangiaceae bacterium]